jgi:sirohydrochlorin ferrochelatase
VKYVIGVHLDADTMRQLTELAATMPQQFPGGAPELVEHLARSAAAGYDRPGSWERGWLAQATGFGSEPLAF